MKDKYEAWKNIKVGVLTWNLAGRAPPQNMDVARLILPESSGQLSLHGDQNQEEVDLYVVGLQEMVKLEMIGSVRCSKDEERILAWE